MYFSRIRRPISSALSEGNLPIQAGNIYEEHKFIWGLFPFDKEAERDFLYRRFDAEGFQQFFVVSNRKPLESLNSWEIAIKSYKPKIVIGTQLHFNLRVNPVVTKMPEGPGSKKRKREDVYMDALAKNKTSYRAGLSVFFDYVTTVKGFTPKNFLFSDCTFNLVLGFLQTMKETLHYAPGTVNSRLAALRSYLELKLRTWLMKPFLSDLSSFVEGCR